MAGIKEEVNPLLERLSDDASIEDVQYQLYVIGKVRNGLDSVEHEGGLTQDQVEERLGKRLVD